MMTGGLKMNAVLHHLEQALGKGDLEVRVGFLEDSTCGINNDQSSPSIAFILEHGAPAANIPPRPFFRNMITRRSVKWGKQFAAFLKANDYDAKLALKGMGLIMGEQLQLEITETVDPPNTEAVAKAKGFNKPLEHSKNMKRSVGYQVTGGEKEKVNGSA